ncbi:MAG: DUF2851 family protein [Chloroflexi bacterium]|nr:DUF2851 family protein [Chloroflexota bacterium]
MEKISEKNVARLWKSGRLSSFRDDMGNEVEVICAGRESTRPGCDFQDVVISVNQEKLVGDVELHLTSDLWQKHGHHINPSYNGIILHVAMWQRGLLPIKLEMGKAVPTVILSGYITERTLLKQREQTQRGHCSYFKSSTGLKKILLQAGMQRFSTKSAKYAAVLQEGDADQALYKGICRALGYSRNTAQFEMLADRLPLDSIIRSSAGSLIKKQAMIIGCAGLLPSQGGVAGSVLSCEKIAEIEREWSALSEKPLQSPALHWNLSNFRPANHPLKRLIYLSHLLQEYEAGGLVRGFNDLLETAVPGSESACLENGLLIYDGHPLIGRSRVREIAVNQILPFLLANAVNEGNLSHVTRVINTYLNYGAMADNELLRYMKQQFRIKESKDLNACAQQGMLHIYHSFCRVKDCSCCPVFTLRRPNRE